MNKRKGQAIFYGIILVLVIIVGFYINRKTVSRQINIEQFDNKNSVQSK